MTAREIKIKLVLLKLLIPIICLLSVSVHATERDHYGIGFGLNAFYFGPEDPQGDADQAFSISPLTFFYLSKLGRDSRVFGNIVYHEYFLDASTKNIAQDVKRYAVTSTYQTRFRMSRTFKPWLGVGMSFASESFDNRFTVDSDGFLAQSFANRDDSGLALELDFMTDINWFDTDLYFRTAYTHPFYDGSGGLNFNVFWIWE